MVGIERICPSVHVPGKASQRTTGLSPYLGNDHSINVVNGPSKFIRHISDCLFYASAKFTAVLVSLRSISIHGDATSL
jgi:hypothetical protein